MITKSMEDNNSRKDEPWASLIRTDDQYCLIYHSCLIRLGNVIVIRRQYRKMPSKNDISFCTRPWTSAEFRWIDKVIVKDFFTHR